MSYIVYLLFGWIWVRNFPLLLDKLCIVINAGTASKIQTFSCLMRNSRQIPLIYLFRCVPLWLVATVSSLRRPVKWIVFTIVNQLMDFLLFGLAEVGRLVAESSFKFSILNLLLVSQVVGHSGTIFFVIVFKSRLVFSFSGKRATERVNGLFP